jgi:hypothetical protein
MAAQIETVTRRLPSASDAVYSNFDHMLESAIVEELNGGDKFAQHAAWNFCGYVYRDENGWHEEVWMNGSPVEMLHGDSVESVIAQANEKFGNN